LSVIETEERLNQPEENVRAALCSGLHKLRHALAAGANVLLLPGDLNKCDRSECTR
jgi:hypothetical protein